MSKLRYFFPAMLLASGAAFAATDLNLELPEMGDPSGAVISPEVERRIGQAFLRHVRQHTTIIDDPEVQAYIKSIGYQLTSSSDASTQAFTFFVVKDPLINAFAAPGGVIGVNSGVILSANTESELAGVIAHEIAHVTQRHMARMFEKQKQLSMPLMAAMLGSILLAIASPEAGRAAMTAVAAGGQQLGINFTRANEEEADRIGLQILARAGYDPRGMPDFFERLQQSSRYYQGNAPEYLRTHPLTSTRIADTRARADQIAARQVPNSSGFELTRMKLMALSEKEPRKAVDRFREMLKSGGQARDWAVRYGYAIALTEAGEYAEGRATLQTLLEEQPENIAFLLAAARLEAAQGNYPAAIRIYRDSAKLYPGYRPLVLAHAKTLLDAGQPDEARRLLRDYARSNEPDLQYYDLLSQAEAQAGSHVESGIAKSEYYYLLGDTHLAIEQLKVIQRQPGMDYYQQERISARLAFLESELELERELKL
jgi:predicted Zn-dependent protease